MVKRLQNKNRGFQPVSGWQRFPCEFALAGWLRPVHPQALPHSALSTLLAVYAQLFERNLQQSPRLTDGHFELNEEQLVQDAGAEDVSKALEILGERGLVLRREGKIVEVRDPVSGSWPPRKFAALPARFMVAHLPQLRVACSERKIETGDALALYIIMLAQRNSKTGEIWYSREKTAYQAGLDPERTERALSALLQAQVMRRPALSRSWLYQPCGLDLPELEQKPPR